jgi:hypothetical protein
MTWNSIFCACFFVPCSSGLVKLSSFVLKFRFNFFGRKEIGTKKLTLGINFTNILREAFNALIFLRQKSANLNCKYKKVVHKTFVQKSCAQNVGEIDFR